MGKRRAFRGAKKKAGDRYPSGDLKVTRQEDLGTPEVAARRMELFPEAPKSQEAGKAERILVRLGIINERQERAVGLYRGVVVRFRIARNLPRGTAKVSNIMVLPTGMMDEETMAWVNERDAMTEEERAKADAEFMKNTMTALKETMAVVNAVRPVGLTRGVLDMVALENVVPGLWEKRVVAPVVARCLTEVLDRLADHFNVKTRAVA